MTEWFRVAGKPAALIAVLVMSGLAVRWLGVDGTPDSLSGQGPAAFVLAAGLACAVGVPRQIVAYAGGFTYGFWPGAALALVAELLGCALNFTWARALAGDAARRWLARRGGKRLDRLARFLDGNTFMATLIVRLLPVGSNLAFNLVAGVSGIAAAPFLAASLLGYVPQTAVFALLGGGIRVSQATQIGLAVALFAASIALGLMLLRRTRGRL